MQISLYSQKQRLLILKDFSHATTLNKCLDPTESSLTYIFLTTTLNEGLEPTDQAGNLPISFSQPHSMKV